MVLNRDNAKSKSARAALVALVSFVLAALYAHFRNKVVADAYFGEDPTPWPVWPFWLLVGCTALAAQAWLYLYVVLVVTDPQERTTMLDKVISGSPEPATPTPGEAVPRPADPPSTLPPLLG